MKDDPLTKTTSGAISLLLHSSNIKQVLEEMGKATKGIVYYTLEGNQKVLDELKSYYDPMINRQVAPLINFYLAEGDLEINVEDISNELNKILKEIKYLNMYYEILFLESNYKDRIMEQRNTKINSIESMLKNL